MSPSLLIKYEFLLQYPSSKDESNTATFIAGELQGLVFFFVFCFKYELLMTLEVL